MRMNITEVQSTCIILTGLITFFLAFFLPKYAKMERKIRYAQKFLTHSTLLITIHFCVQYYLHKNANDVAAMRTVINLFFGIPISYFFNISYLYLLRDGKIRKWEWWIAPLAMVAAIIVFMASFNLTKFPNQFTAAIYMMSFIYGSTLLYYRFLLLQSYFQVRREIRDNQQHPLYSLLKWTKWSLWVLIFTALGFPIMTFCPNTLMRSLYGILAISSLFFYILSFVGYSLTCNTETEKATTKENAEESSSSTSTFEISEQMAQAIDSFIEKNYYTTPGITMKDAAVQMGISCNKLRLWLRTTEFEKFNNWIVFLRIEKSKELMIQHPALNNQEIAEKCGFCDRQYFQLQFSKLEGISPSKWIKERMDESLQG